MVKPIDLLPVVHMPENYPYVVPSCMAQAAMEYGPIFRIDWPPMKKAVCLVGPEANELFYHSHERDLSHEIGWAAILQVLVGKGMLSLDVPEHSYYRKLINPLMTARYVASEFDILCEIIRRRIGTWRDGKVIDLYDEVRAIAFTVIAKLLCGIEDMDEIRQLRDAFRRLVTPGHDPNTETRKQFLERFSAQDEINRSLSRHIAARRKARADHQSRDLIDILIEAKNWKGQQLSREEILSHLRTMLTAGHETSTVLGTALLYLLAAHPTYLERVRPEFDLLPQSNTGMPEVLARLKAMRLLGYALQEASRMYGPTGNLPRGVIKEFEFGGFLVPAGTFIMLSAPGGHWLPTVFPRPERFDPDRFAPPREEDRHHPHALISFASGTRMCMGINLAQIELKALAAIVLNTWELAPAGQGLTVAYFTPDGFLPYGLKMRVRRRQVVS